MRRWSSTAKRSCSVCVTPGCTDTCDGRTPAVHTIDAVGSSVPSRSTTPRSSADATSVLGAHVDAAVLELAPRVLRQTLPERRQHAVAAFEQHDAHVGRRELGILVRQHEPHELGERARELDSGRAAADDAEREQPPPLVGVGGDGRLLEAVEHVVAELQRLAEILEAERGRLDRRRCRSSS